MKKIICLFLLLILLYLISAASAQNYKEGDIITFGHFEQDADKANGPEPIEWRILKINNDRALLISEYGLATKGFVGNFSGKEETWENSFLRFWLNGAFYDDSFTNTEKQLIQPVTIHTPNNPVDGSFGGNDTVDRIFLLDVEEVKYYYRTEKERLCKGVYAINESDPVIGSWWLRSPGEKDPYYGNTFTIVDEKGSISEVFNFSTMLYARPVLWLDLGNYTGAAEPVQLPGPAQPDNAVGKLILFGKYEQDNNSSNGPEPIIWQVLTVENGKALVLSKYNLHIMAFDENRSLTNWRFPTWETSSPRDWLNGSFYNSAFSKDEKNRIIEVTNENPDNPDWGTDGGNPTKDHIFLLSLDDVYRYFDKKADRLVKQTKSTARISGEKYWNFGGDSWMLRTPGQQGGLSKVTESGEISMICGNGGEMPRGIRPALWMNLNGLELYDKLPDLEKQVEDDSHAVDWCSMRSYLHVGDHAEVVTTFGIKMRKKPAGAETGVQAFSGKDIRIIDGPVCQDGVVWWKINFLGYEGWSMEGKDGTYYFRRVDNTPVKTPSAATSSSAQNSSAGTSHTQNAPTLTKCGLKLGDMVEVVNINGLQLYMQPKGKTFNDVIAFPGKSAKITDGPKVLEGINWWEIDFLGHRGWVMESSNKKCYLSKTGEAAVSSPTAAAASSETKPSADTSQNSAENQYSSRLRIGDSVQVVNTTGLQLYMEPNAKPYSGVLAFPGKNAKITDGPKNLSGVIWWEIDFLGYRGWVIEFTPPSKYYLEKVK